MVEMDADFSHDPADLPRLLERAAATGPTSCSARATSTAAAWRTGSSLRRVLSRGGCRYARAVLGVGVRDLTGGFKCFRADDAARDRLRDRALGGLRLPGRADLPRARARAARSRRSPIVFRDRARRRLEDVRADRARGDLARARAAARPPARRAPGGPRLRGTGDPADPRRDEDRERLAVVQGWADTRADAAALERRRPPSCCAPWALGSLAVAVAAARRRRGSIATLSTPGPDAAATFPGVTGARRRSATTASCCSATRSCSRCTRSRASPASWRAPRCRSVAEGYRGVWRRIHERPARWRSPSSCAATLFSLVTQAYVLGRPRLDAGRRPRHLPGGARSSG